MLKALLFSLVLICTALPQYSSMYYYYNPQPISGSSGGGGDTREDVLDGVDFTNATQWAFTGAAAVSALSWDQTGGGGGPYASVSWPFTITTGNTYTVIMDVSSSIAFEFMACAPGNPFDRVLIYTFPAAAGSYEFDWTVDATHTGIYLRDGSAPAHSFVLTKFEVRLNP